VKHPCQFSPEILEILATLISPYEHVHDPFAGPGTRLAALCDQRGATFSGTDIEDWPDTDARVAVGSALDPTTYPHVPFTIITSPVYVNKRCADYANGPLPTTRLRGRRDYGIALGRALHEDNLARLTGRHNRATEYWEQHRLAVKLWPGRVILNCDKPIYSGWRELLGEVDEVIPAYTRRYRGLDNADKRAAFEVVLVRKASAT
jgi:hypothetical protein